MPHSENEIMQTDIEYAKVASNPHPETRVISYLGYECKVYFNYCAPGDYGSMPTNHWIGIHMKDSHVWLCPMDDSVGSLDEACEAIEPMFQKAIEKKR